MVKPKQLQKSSVAYLSFSAPITEQTAEGLLSACCNFSNQGAGAIYVALSTPGGSVQSAIYMYNLLRGLPARIIMHNISAVDSAGTVVFCAGDERYANPNTSFMFHGVGFDLRNANLRLDAKLLKERLDSIEADQIKIAGIIAERTNIPPDELNSLFLQQGTMTPDSALKYGLINKVKEFVVPKGFQISQAVFNRQVAKGAP